jgi:hypothetical protein
VEIATYPERRLDEQVLRDAMLVFLDRREWPEVLTIVLRPRGRLRVRGVRQLRSRRGWSDLKLMWRVVELRSVPARDLLASNDVGLIPWVPLAKFDDPPAAVLEQCRAAIDRLAPSTERENLLVVPQVLTQLRYNDPELLSLLGGRKLMIESLLIQEFVAGRMHKDILTFLAARFGKLPAGISPALARILDEDRLEELTSWAAVRPDAAAFQSRLESKP